MTHAQHEALLRLLPDLHSDMLDEVPPPVQDSIFKQLGLTGKSGAGDEDLLMAHAIIYALYGFRPGQQTIAESYAQRHLEKAEGDLRAYLSAIAGIRFSIYRVLDSLPGQQDGQVRLLDELDPPNKYVVWFDVLAELHREKSVAGLLGAEYIIPVFSGYMHLSILLTASEELLAEAIGRRERFGSKASAQRELIKFITRRALHEEMEIRDRAADQDE